MTSSDELSAAIAKEVLFKLNSAIEDVQWTATEVQRPMSDWTNFMADDLKQITNTDELVEEIRIKLDAFIRRQQSVTGQVRADKKINLATASTVGEAVTAVINKMETCLNGHDRNTPAKTWLASVKTVVKYITCHGDCVGICPSQLKDLEGHEELKELDGQSQIPPLRWSPVFMDDFPSKAKMVASEVLNGEVKSSPSTSLSTVSAEKAEKENGHIFKYFLQSIEETSADIIQTFIEEVKSIAWPSTNRNSPVADKAVAQTLPNVPLVAWSARTDPIQTAAKRVYYKIMMKLKEFFTQLPFHQSQTSASDFHAENSSLTMEDNDSLDLDDGTQTSGPQRKCKSDQALPVTRPLDPFVPRKVHSDSYCPFSRSELDTCSQNVLKAVLASYLSTHDKKTSVKGTSAPLPSASSSVEDSLLFYLGDLTSSSSSNFFSEDSFSTLSFSLTAESTTEELSDVSIPCMKGLSSVKFQMNAFEEVTDVLVNFLQSHTSLKSCASNNSCEIDDWNGKPWLDYFSKDLDANAVVIDQGVTDSQKSSPVRCPITKSSDEVVVPITDVIHKLCRDDLHAEVSKEVGQVLLQSVETFTGTACHLSIDSTVSDVVDTVVGGIQAILHTTLDMPSNSPDKTGNSGRGLPNICLRKVVNGTCEMFRALQEKVKHFSNNILLYVTMGSTETYAKQAISNALTCIKEDLTSLGLYDSEDLNMVDDILNLMLRNINGVASQEDQDVISEETRRSVSLSTTLSTPSTYVSGWSDSSENILPAIVTTSEQTVSGAIFTQKCIHNKSMEIESFAGISQETVINVVKTVSQKLNLEDEVCGSSHLGDLKSVAEKIEKSLSKSIVSPQDLVGTIYDLLLRDSSIVPRKSVSDTVLLKSRDYEGLKKQIAFELVQSFAWETMKHLLLPCFEPPASWTIEQSGCLVQPCASASCLGFVMNGLVDGRNTPKPSKSPCEILTDTLKMLTEAVVKDVMNSFPLSLNTVPVGENQTKKISASSHNLGSVTSKMAQDSQENIAMSNQKPAQLEADNVACLASVLMLRLLMKSNITESQSSYMAKNSKQVMDRILSMLDGATSASSASSEIRETFRAVYHDLLHQFGPEMIFSKALETKNSAFESALLISLQKHILKTDAESESPSLAESVSQRKKIKKGILQFLRKIPKLFQKVTSVFLSATQIDFKYLPY